MTRDKSETEENGSRPDPRAEDPGLTQPMIGAARPIGQDLAGGRTTRLPSSAASGHPGPDSPPASERAATRQPAARQPADQGPPPYSPPTLAADAAPTVITTPEQIGAPVDTGSPDPQISRPFAPNVASGAVQGTPAAGSQGPMPVGSVLANRYRITRVLGVGGMGEVYAVRDESLEIDVALKVMRSEVAADASFLQRFRNELLVARQITHPNVVRIHDLGQDGPLLFMTMDMVEGRSLADLLETEGRIEAPRAVALVRQVADALGAAHAKGVVHRDLKPANILLDAAGTAYVTDFGIARSHSFSGLTRTGEVLGTPDYLAPEQARGEEVDGRTDIYALGLIFFELVSGERPFSGGTLVEILTQHMHGRTRTFQELGVRIDPGLEAVVARCLAPDPVDRYATAAELVADLDDLERPRQRHRAARRRHRILRTARIAGATCLALLLLAGVYQVWQTLGPSREDAPPIAAGPPAADPGSESAPEPPGPGQAVPDLPSILVLPFGTSTESAPNEELELWARIGLPDQLAERLLGGGGSRVVPMERVARTLADLDFAVDRPSESDLSHLAGIFGVDHVLVGELGLGEAGWSVEIEALSSDGASSKGRRTIFQGTEAAASPLALVATAESALGSALGVELASGGELGAGNVGAGEGGELEIPSEAATAYYRGLSLRDAGNPAAAEEALRQAVEQFEGYGDAWLALAEVRQAQDRPEEAHDAVQRAVDAGMISMAGAHRARTLLARLEGEPSSVRAELERWVRELPGDTEARFHLALALAEQGQMDRAIGILDALRRFDPSHSQTWYYLGRFTILAGDPGRAVDDYLVEALAQARRAGDAPAEARTLNAMGVGYQRLGKPEQARRRYADAAEIQLNIGDRNGYAVAQLNIGRISSVQGELDAAEGQLRQALDTFEEIGNVGGQADAINAMGVLRENQGRYEEALEEYRRALRLHLESGNRSAAAESYSNVGFAYLEMANYTDAGLNLEQALVLFRELENAYGVMLVLQSRASARLAQGAWEEANRDLLDALTTSRELQIPQATAASKGYLGKLATLRGRYDEALRAYDEALEIFDGQGDMRGQVEFGLARAETLLQLGDRQAVSGLLERVDDWLSEGGSAAQRSHLRRLQGHLARESGDLETARRRFTEALADGEASRSAATLLEAKLAVAAAGAAEVAGTGSDVRTLEEVLDQARRLGHVPLELRSAEALAAAHLRAGSAEAADDPLRRALGLARKVGEYARAHHLHALRARLLDARGEESTAEQALATALGELDRLLDHVPKDLRPGFEAVEEVAELLAQRPGPGAGDES